MSVRKEVFQAKVLQRLYPAPPKPEKGSPARHPEEAISPKSLRKVPIKVTGLSGRKLYTVLPAPEDYLPVSGDESARPTDPEPVNNADEMHAVVLDSAEDEERTSTRRKRRRKTKAAGPADGRPPPCVAGDNPTLESLSKNKRRKLKKKRHKEKLRALGLMPRSRALEFTYKQSEEEEVEEEEGDGEGSEKLKDLLEFLQSTQELYFSDRSHVAASPPLCVSTVESLLTHLMDATSPTALVSNLYQLRALLAQGDVERLREALREFSRTSELPNDETEAVCSLFHYWMTRVLPMKDGGTT